jgi:hypothetical protein
MTIKAIKTIGTISFIIVMALTVWNSVGQAQHCGGGRTTGNEVISQGPRGGAEGGVGNAHGCQ